MTGRRLTEGSLDHRNFCRCSIQSGERTPVIDHYSCANDFGSSIDCACYEWDLEEGGKLVEFRTGSLRMD